jgi:ankyrin repeat protein
MNLYDCISNDDIVGATNLLQQGHNPNQLDKYGQTPLFSIVYNKSPRQKELLKLFIDFGANVNFQKPNDEATPLHNSRGDIADILIKSGADTTIMTKSGSTPLHCALDLATAKILVDSGLSINAKNNYSLTPLHNFVYFDIELVQYAISNGADVSATDINGFTPLICLAQTEYVTQIEGKIDTIIEKAQLLLDSGADVNAKDIQNKTAYDHAIMVDNLILADWLRDRQKNKNGI